MESLMEGSKDGAIQLYAANEAVARHTKDPDNKYKGRLRACLISLVKILKTQPIFRAQKYYVMVNQTDTGAIFSGH